MSKDRAAPFSRKHRRYWLPVTGGMILIGAINVALGMCSYEPPPSRTESIQVVIPPPSSHRVDAGVPEDAVTPMAPVNAP